MKIGGVVVFIDKVQGILQGSGIYLMLGIEGQLGDVGPDARFGI